MAVKEVIDPIYWIGAIDWDRRLFDELIPLPDGTSYNAYLVKHQEEGLLIDSVDPSRKDEFFQNIKKANIKKISYLIAHHAEQDHAGCIGEVLKEFPDCRIITNQKCKALLMDELHLEEEVFHEIRDGEIFSFGGQEFQFIFAPWVHWPETFLTYLPRRRLLFTCDLFGSHLATSELWASRDGHLCRAAKRYYAEIMMPFRQQIKKYLSRLKNLSIDMIAPSHGPVYRNPGYILQAYQDWVSDKVKDEVVIPYISMHGSTEEMVSYLVEALMERNIKVTPFHLIHTDIGELAMALVDAATVILASPTVLKGPHPQVVYAAYLCNILKPKVRFAGLIGSFGWGSRMEQDLLQLLTNLQVEFFPSVMVKSYPRKEDFDRLSQLAALVAEKHQKICSN